MEWHYVFDKSQCGTDLGLIKTKAEKNNNGTFTITGQKYLYFRRS